MSLAYNCVAAALNGVWISQHLVKITLSYDIGSLEDVEVTRPDIIVSHDHIWLSLTDVDIASYGIVVSEKGVAFS